ncbi:hypothetical protein EHH60_24590 [Bradyrhizobium sp. RP6]|nr:hypothetical protein EHH60_24590 [Bradyrhizobium sp. RP6]
MQSGGDRLRSNVTQPQLSPRHCEERERRSNPESLRGKILDCFAALATTWRMSVSAKYLGHPGRSKSRTTARNRA